MSRAAVSQKNSESNNVITKRGRSVGRPCCFCWRQHAGLGAAPGAYDARHARYNEEARTQTDSQTDSQTVTDDCEKNDRQAKTRNESNRKQTVRREEDDFYDRHHQEGVDPCGSRIRYCCKNATA